MLRILLVEDDPDHAELIGRSLQGGREPTEIAVARSVREARAILDAEPPDLVVTDYMLPDGNGTELLAPDAPCPVIIVTSRGDEELAVRSIKDGAIDYVRKDPSGGARQLGDAIRRALREWRLQREKLEQERKVRELSAHLSAVFDSTEGLAIMTADPDGTIRSFNRGGEQMLGWRADEVCGHKTPLDFHPPDQASELRRHFAAGGLPTLIEQLASREPRWTYRRRDGRNLPVAIQISPIRDGSGYVLTATDITAQIETEQQIARAERFAGLGRLASGIAHDFNNVLAAIMALATDTEHVLDAGDTARARHNQAEILRAGRHASAMIERVFTFGRGDAVHDGISDIPAVIQDCVTLAATNLPAGLSPVTELAPDLPAAAISPTSLRQAILNLLINAGRAAGSAGSIRVTAAHQADVDSQRCASCGDRFAGAFVVIGVEDSGPGVPEALRSTLFEPFVTSSQDPAGTGIGLSVVHSVVHAVGGHAGLEVDEGSRFSIFLPVSREAATEARTPPQAASIHAGRLLFVDDEDRVRHALARLIRRLGYDVVDVASAAEALAAFANDPTGFDLVVTDDRMPGKTGLELAAELLALQPTLPIILSSGHRAVTEDKATELGLAGVLRKPYDLAQLERALTAALARRREPPP